MPWVDRFTRAQVLLYNRCRSWERLPKPGGLMDQDETTMQYFDLIDALIAKNKQKNEQELELKMRAQKALRGMHG